MMSLLDLIFPKRCINCHRIGCYFCKRCVTQIKFIEYQICSVCQKYAIDGMTHPKCKTRFSLDGLISFFHYEGIIRQAIKAVKYRLVSDISEEIINLIPSSSIKRTFQQSGNSLIIVPIPLHPARLRFRGFNQAEVLGKFFAKRLGVPIRTDILKRVRKTIPQVEMKDRKKRLKNMEGVFSVNSRISGIHDAVIPVKSGTASGQLTIILFDDVFTTGATIRSAANILKKTGANSVWAVTLAHG